MRGVGKRSTVSTSNTRNKTERMKKYKENGDREPFSRSSNPHSIGFALSRESLVVGGVSPRKIIIIIMARDSVRVVTRISQNILLGQMQAHLPVRLPCYDLSPLSARATGDLYTSQSLIQINYVFNLTFKSFFIPPLIRKFITFRNCNPFTLYHRLYFDLTCCGRG